MKFYASESIYPLQNRHLRKRLETVYRNFLKRLLFYRRRYPYRKAQLVFLPFLNIAKVHVPY